MDLVKRLVSSRSDSTRSVSTALNRPFTSLTSATGLIMPKSSRGRTTASIRRQVQDKSYWLAVLSEKINDLEYEINRLNRANEQMQRNELKSNLMEQSAKNLAKELKEKSFQLTAYNEYFERICFNENEEDVETEIEFVRKDKESLCQELEIKYKQKKEEEEKINDLTIKLKQKHEIWSGLLMKFNNEHHQRYNDLDNKNKKLNESYELQEQKIIELKQKIQTLEQSKNDLDNNFIFKKEIFSSLERLHKLELQEEDLDEEDDLVNKKSKLLALFKHQNRELNNLEKKKSLLKQSIQEKEDELNEYQNLDEQEKYENLIQQEQGFDEFMLDFENNLTKTKQKLNLEQLDLKQMYDKCLKLKDQIDLLKNLDKKNLGEENVLINQKLKFELDLAKLEKLKQQTIDEINLLNQEINDFENQILNFDQIDNLKNETKLKLEQLNQLKLNLEQENERLIVEKDKMNSIYLKLKQEIENENLIFNQLIQLEVRLKDLVEKNFNISNLVYQNDYEHLKARTLDTLSKYNEKLLGF